MFVDQPPSIDRSSTPPAALTFFNDVQAAQHEAAEKAGGQTEYTYRLGANTIRLYFAGDALIPVITPALEHLRVPIAANQAADLTVYLWDVKSTGVQPPARAWEWEDNPARGDVRSLSDTRFQTAYNHHARLLNLLDRERNIALYCISNVADMPFDFRGSPLLNILHWWPQTRGLQLVHGGAVGLDTGGVLIVGKGGSGKSTTTLACLQSKLQFAADDYCLLQTEGTPSIYSVYSSAKVEVDNLQRLPHLKTLMSNPDALDGNGEKATIFLKQHYPEKLISHFPLKAVLVPRITGEPQTHIKPTSRMNAMQALTISTMVQLSGADKAAFDGIADVIKQVPSFALELGTDLRQVVAALENFLAAPR
ncbi:MAG: serine kinase [Burkholderiales bacterium]|nr:serine kinase [Anaerolineae bacterium]